MLGCGGNVFVGWDNVPEHRVYGGDVFSDDDDERRMLGAGWRVYLMRARGYERRGGMKDR